MRLGRDVTRWNDRQQALKAPKVVSQATKKVTAHPTSILAVVLRLPGPEQGSALGGDLGAKVRWGDRSGYSCAPRVGDKRLVRSLDMTYAGRHSAGRRGVNGWLLTYALLRVSTAPTDRPLGRDMAGQGPLVPY